MLVEMRSRLNDLQRTSSTGTAVKLAVTVILLLAAAGCIPAQPAAPAASPNPGGATTPATAPVTAASPTPVASPAMAAKPASPAVAPAAQASPAANVRVATSISVLADMIRNVGGGRLAVTNIVPAGSDVHTLQVTPQDIQTITTANLLFLNGGGLESAIEPTIRNNIGPTAQVVELFQVVPEDQRIKGAEHAGEAHAGEEKPAGQEGGSNPHAWLDPRLGARYVGAIRDVLVQADPNGRDTYEANAQRYISEIEQLDGQLQQQVQEIPAANRKLVTFHDAFPYMARRYGLDLVGVVVASPQSEPSAAQVADLVQKIKTQNVKAVYSEPQINPRVLELAARDAGLKVLPLYSDSLDQTVATYLDLLRHNARQLVEGLR
jgi:ABC-type Zn uptake system ZnuABC Zn-binding protein ZnuA